MNDCLVCPNGGIPGPLACPVPRCACCEVPLRDELAVVLHKMFCNSVRCKGSMDGPCWTAWRQEADLLMIPVELALAKAWEDGARNGARGLLPRAERAKRNPYLNHSRDEPCGVCNGEGGWVRHHGGWEACRECEDGA